MKRKESVDSKQTAKERKSSITRKNSTSTPPAEKTKQELQENVKELNEGLMKDGERLFFEKIPQKIKDLTTYINVR